MNIPKGAVTATSHMAGKRLQVHVTATPMTDAERQDLARAVSDLVFLALPQVAAFTPTTPTSGPDAMEAA